MTDNPYMRKRSLPKALGEPELGPNKVAGQAEIRRPPQQQIRDDESSVQLEQIKKQTKGSLPNNILEAARLAEEMKRQGMRPEGNSQTMMEFLRESRGDDLSAELLSATAILLASIPEKRKQNKKRLWDLYRQWASETSTVLISKVINAFKQKKD